MEELNLGFLDNDYGTVSRGKGEKSRQIKTRRATFNAVVNAWNKFRISLYTGKLEGMKYDALTSAYKSDGSRLTGRAEKKMMKKATAIARLEEKIGILRRENVPENYVSERAIKLKNNMIGAVRYNCNNAYVIGLDKENEIFNEEQVVASNVGKENFYSNEVDGVVPSLDELVSTHSDNNSTSQELVSDVSSYENSQSTMRQYENEDSGINVVPTDNDALRMGSIVEDSFTGAYNAGLERDEIAELINSTMGSLENDGDNVYYGNSEDLNNSEVEPISPEEVRAVVGEAYENVPDEHENGGIPLSYEDVNSVVNGAYEGVSQGVELGVGDIAAEIDAAMGNVKVSSAGRAARIDRYDQDGEPKVGYGDNVEDNRYDYSPMSDEEIARARENIGIDEVNTDYSRYVPMSDEEIVSAQNNIGYAEYNGTYGEQNGTIISEQVEQPVSVMTVPEISFKDVFRPAETVGNVLEAPAVFTENDVMNRELPMIAPERQLSQIYYNDVNYSNEDDQNLHFDLADTTAKDINNYVGQTTSLDELEELKRRARELQQQQQLTREEVTEAERVAAQAAAEAAEARRIKEEADKAYEMKVQRLRLYTEALEEDCTYNKRRASVVGYNAECDRRFVDDQIRQVNDREALMEQIDEIIAPEAENVIRRR